MGDAIQCDGERPCEECKQKKQVVPICRYTPDQSGRTSQKGTKTSLSSLVIFAGIITVIVLINATDRGDSFTVDVIIMFDEVFGTAVRLLSRHVPGSHDGWLLYLHELSGQNIVLGNFKSV